MNTETSTEINQSILKNALRNGICTVTFTKKGEGTERVMRCTLNENHLPPKTPTNGTEKPSRTPPANMLVVWDLEKSGWRSFYMDSVTSWVAE
jgi:hypothetical protein